jgi:hypothetical protein
MECPQERPDTLGELLPPTVALTRLLAVPYWRSLALNNPDGDPIFVNEMRRTVAPSYYWEPSAYYRYYEPVVRWFMDEREEFHRRQQWPQRTITLDIIEPGKPPQIRGSAP